jgi:hypothetical protein
LVMCMIYHVYYAHFGGSQGGSQNKQWSKINKTLIFVG